MEVKEAEREAEGNGDGCVEQELAQADAEVARVGPKVETCATKLADGEEAPDTGIEQEHFVEDGQVGGPGGLEPAQVNGKPQDGEHEKVGPGGTLVWISPRRIVEEQSDGQGQSYVEGQPRSPKGVRGDDQVRKTKKGGSDDAGWAAESCDKACGCGGSEACCEEWKQGERGGEEECRGDRRHGYGMVAGRQSSGERGWRVSMPAPAVHGSVRDSAA